MAKLKTEQLHLDSYEDSKELFFKYDIYVDKEGNFSTTLSKDVVELFEAANIDLKRNRLHNKGYFADKTIDGLNNQIKEIAKEYLSRELVEEKMVIQYNIRTTCSYCLNTKGEVVPNGDSDWTGSEKWNWHNGTKTTDAAHPEPFGLLVYAKPFVKQTFKYKSGKTKIEYKMICYSDAKWKELKEEQFYLRWLDDVCSIEPVDEDELQEVDYSEKTAAFFVNMIKSICQVNERIKDLINPESIVKIANLGLNVLGDPEK